MATNKTILVPFDFDDASQEALSLALSLADSLGFSVVLLHAAPIPLEIHSGPDPVFSFGALAEATSRTEDELAELAAERGADRAIVRPGDPATEITRVIDELEPALVVMGTHARAGLSRALLGSVAEEVTRSSRAPVLRVRVDAH